MIVILPFVINAGMNFVLGLLVALFLGPDLFGVYAIGAAILVLVNTALVDWLKLAAIRFYSLVSREKQPEIRATLDVLAAGIAIVTSFVLAAAAFSGIDFRMPVLLLATAVAGGICAGLFDFHGAIARARYLDAAYARLIIVKNLLALLLMVGVAWATKDPALVLLGGLVSAAIALMSVRHVLADAPLAIRAARRDLVWTFARYGFPLVGANVLYSLMPLFNRSALAGAYGFAEAGYFSLASDMGIRLFGTLGAALEIILLREVVRLDQTEGHLATHARIAANLPLVLLVLLPVAVGWWIALPAFEQVFVPASFRGHFSGYMTILTPAFLALGLLQAGLNPVFLIAKRTGLAIWAAGIGLAANLALVWAGPAIFGPQTYAMSQTAGFLAAFAITAFFALSALEAKPDLKALALVIAANAVMAAALWPLRGHFSAPVELLLLTVVGTAIYGVLVLGGNIAGCRTIMQQARARKTGA
jgi:O-antigen/teichoic acid export membrane protein